MPKVLNCTRTLAPGDPQNTAGPLAVPITPVHDLSLLSFSLQRERSRLNNCDIVSAHDAAFRSLRDTKLVAAWGVAIISRGKVFKPKEISERQ